MILRLKLMNHGRHQQIELGSELGDSRTVCRLGIVFLYLSYTLLEVLFLILTRDSRVVEKSVPLCCID